jgi:hypothetical protein
MNYGNPMVSTRLDEIQSIETKAVEPLKEIGRRLARFPLKVNYVYAYISRL